MDLNNKTNVWGSSIAKTRQVQAESQRYKADCVVQDLGIDLVLTDDGSSRKPLTEESQRSQTEYAELDVAEL
eukprot:2206174-Amphidinium_carterae.1